MNIKDNFHHLIDSIDDEELLKACYQLMEKIRDEQDGHLWNSLSEVQQKELLAAYEESFDEHNLLSHEAVKLQHEKWLKAFAQSATAEMDKLHAVRSLRLRILYACSL